MLECMMRVLCESDVQVCHQRLSSAFDLLLIFLCSLIQTLTHPLTIHCWQAWTCEMKRAKSWDNMLSLSFCGYCSHYTLKLKTSRCQISKILFSSSFFQIMAMIQGDYETERRLITSSENITRSNQLILSKDMKHQETILETNSSKSNWQDFNFHLNAFYH